MKQRPRARRLGEIAAAINGSDTGYRATTRPDSVSTDFKPKGLRYITRKGKGRRGVELEVYNPQGARVLRHSSAETYRTNREVERWLCEELALKSIARMPREQWW